MLVVELVILRKQGFNFIDKSFEKSRLVVDIVVENLSIWSYHPKSGSRKNRKNPNALGLDPCSSSFSAATTRLISKLKITMKKYTLLLEQSIRKSF